jgi:hypothetical protein
VCGWRHEGFLFAMARHRDVRLGDVSQAQVRPNANRRRRVRIEDLRRDRRDDRNGAAALVLQRRRHVSRPLRPRRRAFKGEQLSHDDTGASIRGKP